MATLRLKNDGGLTRDVPTGFSLLGFFLTGMIFIFRGIFLKGFVYLFFIYSFQGWMLIAVIFSALGDKDLASFLFFFSFLITLLPCFVFGFKVNKWTARHWIDRGYKPIGPGWDVWGPKWGVDVGSAQ